MEEADVQRKIIHVDMDAFYASVEQLDFPELRGKPIAVGGGAKRGVVAAASYEARKYGVRSAMSGALAAKKCPNLIFVRPRFERYKEISTSIREVFYEYTPLVEPLSLDEAYLDVTHTYKQYPSATLLAQEIRQKIKDRTGLNASAGISTNKFVAKIASDINKPNGQKTIPPHEIIPFLETLGIEKFYGVGKVTASKMYNLGIFTGADLKSKSKEFLEKHFRKSGIHYYNIVRGIYNSSVKPNRARKSIATENTFETNLTSEIHMLEKLNTIADSLEQRMLRNKERGKTITLKLKYSDFSQQTRSKTLAHFLAKKEDFFPIIKDLLYQEKPKNSVRLLGIGFSNLESLQEDKPQKELQYKLPL